VGDVFFCLAFVFGGLLFFFFFFFVFLFSSLDTVNERLSELGLQIGKRIAERLTRESSRRFATDLETVRFICKDFWSEINSKTADGLRTDKNGTYEVEEKSFRFLRRISANSDVNVNDEAMKYLALPCGIIKGALEMYGYHAHVKCVIVALPAVKFTITIPK
jgi:hypothetical protein